MSNTHQGTASMQEFIRPIEEYLKQDQTDASISKYAQSITLPIAQHKRENEHDSFRFHELWGAFVLLAKQLTKDDVTKLDRLAALVKAIQDQGTLTSDGQPVKVDGLTAWTETPYLGLEMCEEWNVAPPRSSPEQWANLSGFAARLTANEACDFSLYAIWSLRDALETPRPFTERQTSEGDAQSKNDAEVSVDELLPAALQWFEYCGDKMVALTVRSHVYTQPGQSNDPAFLGKLASESGIAKGGYSVRRWRFWKKRLEEISQARDNAGGREKVAKLAYQGLQRINQIDHEVTVMDEDMDALHGV